MSDFDFGPCTWSGHTSGSGMRTSRPPGAGPRGAHRRPPEGRAPGGGRAALDQTRVEPRAGHSDSPFGDADKPDVVKSLCDDGRPSRVGVRSRLSVPLARRQKPTGQPLCAPVRFGSRIPMTPMTASDTSACRFDARRTSRLLSLLVLVGLLLVPLSVVP